MAIKKVGTLPEATRGATASPVFTNDELDKMKDSVGEWFLVAERLPNAAKYTAWATKNEGFKVATRTVDTERYTISKGEKEGQEGTRRYVDVYAKFDPEDKGDA